VAKNENPANLPECRPFERFWYLLKAEVYRDDLCAPNLKQLERKIRTCVKNFNLDLLVTLFGGVRSKIRNVGRNGTVETRQMILNYRKKIFLSKSVLIFNKSLIKLKI